jgi:hypothetical protein
MREEAKIVDIKSEHVETSKLPQAFSEPGGNAESITQIARRMRTELGRPLLLLAADFINNDVVDYFYKFRRALINAAKSHQADGPDIDVLIHSPGGELNSCFLIGRLLGRWLKSWEALVPGYACSGATLMCLGSSNIVMSQLGQLGPLDPQERFFDGERRSPIEAFRAFSELRAMVLDSVDHVMEFLLERKVDPERALKAASEMVLQLIQPVVAKIEPCDLGTLALDRLMASSYCERIASPDDPTKKTQRKVDLQSLVGSYPTHDFVIDIEEARTLGFQLSEANPTLEDLFDEIRPLLEEIHLYVGFVP